MPTRASVGGSAALIVLGWLLRHMRHGELTVSVPDGRAHVFRGDKHGPSATLVIKDPSALRRLALGGAVGFGEAYLDGLWETRDLPALLENLCMNLDALRHAVRLPAPLAPLQRALHALRPNTLGGARKNIACHYDLSNEFYRLWLDRTMTYSCAIFERPDDDLETAQRRKWDGLLERLGPRRGERMLEIGCGWGEFAIHAAKVADCCVTGVTISKEQRDWARRRVREEGLEDQVEIRLQDYRDVEGRFDRIASIEMFEAVGEQYWPTFFATLRRLLRPRGRAAVQTITISEALYPLYRRNADFIQRHVFPGGMLPSVSAFIEHAREQRIVIGAPAFFGASYALTLHHWLERFERSLDRVRALGFDDRLERLWRYYLSYCIAGFKTGRVDVMQVQLGAD